MFCGFKIHIFHHGEPHSLDYQFGSSTSFIPSVQVTMLLVDIILSNIQKQTKQNPYHHQILQIRSILSPTPNHCFSWLMFGIFPIEKSNINKRFSNGTIKFIQTLFPAGFSLLLTFLNMGSSSSIENIEFVE